MGSGWRPVGRYVVTLFALVGPVGVSVHPPPVGSPAPAGVPPLTTIRSEGPDAARAPLASSIIAPGGQPQPSREAYLPIPEPEGAEERGQVDLSGARLPGAALQAALQGWVAGQTAARSVAVGVALADASTVPWTGEAHLGAPLAHSDDEYGILSITKTFTEALVLREVALGHIDLDAPIPPIRGVDPDRTAAGLTPRMLLQHSSGLVNYPKAVGYEPTRPITPQEIVALSLHSPRLFEPGTRVSYSNTNFHWLGLLLEEVTDRSYADLVHALTEELDLTQTRLDPTGRPGWIGYSSGGLRSTVRDLARWGAALFTPDRVLPAAQLSGLTTIGEAGVSLGLWPLCPCRIATDGTEHPTALHQTVANGGLYYFPARKVVVVVHYESAGARAAAADGAELAQLLNDVLEPEAAR